MESLAGVPPLSRKEKRKVRKKLRRKELRQQAAKEEHDLLDSTPEKNRIESEEQIEAERIAAEQADHDEQEKLWLEREEKAMEDFRIRQEERRKLDEDRKNWDIEDDAGSTDEDRPAEVIWQGNEIIVKKPRVKRSAKPHPPPTLHDADNSAENPASNPLPPQTAVFAARTQQHQPQTLSEQAPTFGTEQDKTNCPFHIKTGVCRFGVRCSRVHVYPDQSFTLLMRNMYIGPGLTWENDEGLEHSDEEVALHYEEFYEDVHSEFLQFGELVNFKVCNNSSLHLRGNVYVHYKTEAAAQAAYSVMNGRFYAGRQITCEFVGVTRWRTALCGEYMKFNYRLCSHGTACNFLHCFRNPRGEYDWADWDSNPPRYWAVKMAKLFGREASFEEEHDDHGDGSRRHGHARSAWTRESLSRERYRHQSRHDFEHGSSQRTRRRHSSESEYSYSDSDESSRNSRRRGRHAHHRPSIFTEGGKSTVIRGNSTRVFRTGSREPVDNEFHELEGDIRQKRHPSLNSTDHGIRRGLLEGGEHIRRSHTYSGKDGEKHSRHRKRHRSKSRDELDDGQSLRSEFRRSRHRSTSSDVENDSTKYIRSGIRNERETETFSRKRKESYGGQRRREGFYDGDSSDSCSTDRNNFLRKGQRKPRRRRSIERQSRKGGHIGIVEKNTSLDIDDRWTGSYDS